MVNMAYVIRRCRSKESDPNSASHDTIVYLPMIREICNTEMLQVASGLVAGVAMCNFLTRSCL